MTYENAWYFKLLFMAGYDDGFDQWLDELLQTQDPIEETVLELSFCRSDRKKMLSLLNKFCVVRPQDQEALLRKLRLFVKEAYTCGRFSRREATTCMYCFTKNFGYFEIYNSSGWKSMYLMDDLLDDAEYGVIDLAEFDKHFLAYLNEGTALL